LAGDIVEVRDGNVSRIARDQNDGEAQIGKKLLSLARVGQVQGNEASPTDVIQTFFKGFRLYTASDAKARVLNTGKEPEAARQQMGSGLWYAVGQDVGTRMLSPPAVHAQAAVPA
jgi:hypothetical protein